MGVCGGKSATEKAVDECLRKRAALLEEQARARAHSGVEAEARSKRILEAHRERPKGYPMATRVRPGLYLGSLYDALDPQFLSASVITHVVNATQANLPGDRLQRCQVPIDDDPDADIHPHLARVCNFIEAAIQGGGVVLVHCEQGISRSATLVSAYAMKADCKSALKVLQALKAQRPVIDPNTGFLEALLEWQRNLNLQDEAASVRDLTAVCAPIAQYKRMEMVAESPVAVAVWRTSSKAKQSGS